jgi:hypothetical protein
MNDTSSLLDWRRACHSGDTSATEPPATFIDRTTTRLLQDDRV